MKDYASDLAERWDGATDKEAKPLTTREAIEGAIREALERAAEVAEQQECSCPAGPCGCRIGEFAANAIRGLGAKP